MTQPLIKAYTYVMNTYINSHKLIMTKTELNLNNEEFNFMAKFIKKHHGQQVLVDIYNCEVISITEKNNLVEQINEEVQRQLYVQYVTHNSFIKIPTKY